VRTFVDLTFAGGGLGPAKVIERLAQVHNVSFLKGPHDLVFHWETTKEYWQRVAAIHQALHGTGVTYRLATADDQGVVSVVGPWRGSLSESEEENPTVDRESEAAKPPTERIP
jgi:hypothetical protein